MLVTHSLNWQAQRMAQSSWEEGDTTVQLDRDESGPCALLPRLSLSISEGPDAGKSFTAQGGRIVLGTHESADLVLADRSVSRFHCEIELSEGRWAVRDLGSRNGTRVNGVRVVSAFLEPGHVLELGLSKVGLGVDPKQLRVALSEADRFGALVGRSVPMRAVFAVLERAAASDVTVLLSGETGTGKEITAEAIHEASERKNGALVVVDCGAVPPQLLEAELFGHERGAFTSAVESREGAFVAAHGGTIFLDEIGELPLDLQPKLLRVLEKREVKPVGNPRYRNVDVRVIAATNRDLKAEVNAGRFRADLYYRLAVLEVRLPALRERPDDVPLLVESVLKNLGFAERPEASLVRNDAVLDQLKQHPWPGNVRELRNYVERALALREAPILAAPTLEDVLVEAGPTESEAVPVVSGPKDLKRARDAASRAFEKKYVEDLLEQHGGNVSAAARAAGVDRKYLYRLLWRNGLR